LKDIGNIPENSKVGDFLRKMKGLEEITSAFIRTSCLLQFRKKLYESLKETLSSKFKYAFDLIQPVADYQENNTKKQSLKVLKYLVNNSRIHTFFQITLVF
jgi:hypothetical protein